MKSSVEADHHLVRGLIAETDRRAAGEQYSRVSRRSARQSLHCTEKMEGIMRTPITMGLIAATTAALGAQTVRTPLPAPGTNRALVVKASEVQDLIKAYPGGNAEIKSIDAGRHVVDFWLEQRKAGTVTGQTAIAHAEITEIYYIVSGTATLMTSGHLTQAAYNEQLPVTPFPGGGRFLTPTWGGKYEGGETHKVGPGDVIVVPPGTSHQWTVIDSPDFAYFIARIDPDKRQAAGLVNSALKK
jgi:mannose-6-phosphate isomerase-like protein (cupin superfamily)